MYSIRIVAIDNSDPNTLIIKAMKMQADNVMVELPDAPVSTFSVVPAIMNYFVNRMIGLHQVVSVSLGKGTNGMWQVQTIDRTNLKDYFG
jgi:hypothetical protein